MKKIYYSIFILFILLVFSCKRERVHIEYKTILIDFSESKGIDISNHIEFGIEEIFLEVTDYSLLIHIQQIELRDNKVFIFDMNRLLVFDTDGRFLNQIGRIGSGPGEYIRIGSFFFEGNNISLYDTALRKIFTYDTNGNFIQSRTVGESVSSIHPISNGKFIGRRNYQGSRTRTPTLAILDENLNFIAATDNRLLTSGVTTFDHLHSFNDNVLYWELLNDTIFSVVNSQLHPKYHIDFQAYRIPHRVRRSRDIPEILNYISSSSSTFAYIAGYVQENATYIRFMVNFGGIRHYVRYNKQTEEVFLRHFYDSENILSTYIFMKYNEGRIILAAYDIEDEYNNYRLLLINDI